MADQVTESKTIFEEKDYPSQDNPREMVPWLNEVAKKLDYYESTVRKLDANKSSIRQLLPELSDPEAAVSYLIKRLIKSLFCAAAVDLLLIGIIYLGLGLVHDYVTPDLFIFDLWLNHWKLIACVLYVVLYVLRAWREIANRNRNKQNVTKANEKRKQLIKEINEENTGYLKILNSDERVSFYQYVVPYLGPSYIYSFAAKYFVKLFLDGRCSTLPDAKNLYEQDQHAIEQRQQYQKLSDEVTDAKYMAGAAMFKADSAMERADSAMSRADSAMAAAASASAAAFSASSSASSAQSAAASAQSQVNNLRSQL
jgi:hypothetical protein